MISHKLKTIFIHVQRTGGQSISKLLKNNDSKAFRLKRTKHLLSSQVREKIKTKIWDKYFKFGFVRNPWDRLVSLYFAILKNQTWKSPLAKYVRGLGSFKDFVYNPIPKKKIYRSDDITINQVNYLKNVNFIGKYENYNQNVKYICKQLNIEYEFIKQNTSNHKHYKCYYTPKLKEIIYHRYKRDIKTFNYNF